MVMLMPDKQDYIYMGKDCDGKPTYVKKLINFRKSRISAQSFKIKFYSKNLLY